MTDNEPYVPLSERLNQDVIHDNFVPKYSALATAQPSRLILIGVWLLFAPMALGAIGMAFAFAFNAPDFLTAVISAVLPLLSSVLATAVLFKQTRRYLSRVTDTEE